MQYHPIEIYDRIEEQGQVIYRNTHRKVDVRSPDTIEVMPGGQYVKLVIGGDQYYVTARQGEAIRYNSQYHR